MTLVYCPVDGQTADALFETFDGGSFCLSTWRDAETGECEARIYTPDAADAPSAAAALVAAGRAIGIELSPETQEFPDEDWTLSYRRWFKLDVISPRLAVCPAWIEYTPPPGQHAVRLDPGLAFGTGRHETTRSCLQFIDRIAAEECSANRSVLDMGTGSGILAIAAAKLGFAPVRAFDLDPLAVDVARENAAANGANVDFHTGSIDTPQPPADIVLANILGPVLIEHAAPVCASVAKSPEARLVLSGILSTLYPDVVAAYAKHGFREADRIVAGEWTSGMFQRES